MTDVDTSDLAKQDWSLILTAMRHYYSQQRAHEDVYKERGNHDSMAESAKRYADWTRDLYIELSKRLNGNIPPIMVEDTYKIFKEAVENAK